VILIKMALLACALLLIALILEWVNRAHTRKREGAAKPDNISSLPRWDDYQKRNFTHEVVPARQVEADEDIDAYCRRANRVADDELEPLPFDTYGGSSGDHDDEGGWNRDRYDEGLEISEGPSGTVHSYDDGDFRVIFNVEGRMVGLYCAGRWWDFRDKPL
jgi:hypothetical protein